MVHRRFRETESVSGQTLLSQTSSDWKESHGVQVRRRVKLRNQFVSAFNPGKMLAAILSSAILHVPLKCMLSHRRSKTSSFDAMSEYKTPRIRSGIPLHSWCGTGPKRNDTFCQNDLSWSTLKTILQGTSSPKLRHPNLSTKLPLARLLLAKKSVSPDSELLGLTKNPNSKPFHYRATALCESGCSRRRPNQASAIIFVLFN